MTARELKEKFIREEYQDKVIVVRPFRAAFEPPDERIIDIQIYSDEEELPEEQLGRIFLKIIG